MNSKVADCKKSTDKAEFLVKYGGYMAFLLLAVFFSVKSSIFFTPHNLVNILLQSSALGIVGLGMTGILIGGGSDVIRGGVDLSLANNLAISTAIFAVLLGKGLSFGVAFLVTLVCALLISAVNAVSVVVIKIIPLLATISMMYILQGLELLVSNNKVIGASHPVLVVLADGRLMGIPVMVVIFAIVAAVMFLLFNRSVYGNWVNAVGGNQQAATNSGININRVIASTYVLAGLMAAIGSVLVVARLSGSVRGIGDMMLFDVLLVGYMSAIFSKLFVPNIPGAILSALFVGMLSNGFTLINVPTYWVYAVKGLLILLAVSISSIQQRRVS